ncbi:hypothetical protein [Mycoplana dimorpha]|uniref:Uncharacterized protein n=1 Tax=Mycoplana dimorpha TaxID=28320 RepID=A0A2T5BE99_MYCDI|nr:hypothetical protein [Mycoplana dimorpha]PTM97325.1 hypothetical protein C7449_102195 [Mycoplana dimorpha]
MNFALARYAGLYVPPAAWAINTQLGQILPYGDCSAGAGWTAVAAFTAAAFAAAGALLSRRGAVVTASRTALFLSRMSFLLGLCFAFALLMQGAATVLISPCLY